MKVRAYQAGVAAAAVAAGVGIFGLAGTASAATPGPLDPVVTKLSVAKGSTAGGTVLTITGKNFDTATGVKVNSVAVTSFLIASPTSIVAKVAASTGSKTQVEVTNPAASSADVVADDFTFLAPMNAAVPAGSLLNPLGKSVITVTTSGAGANADAFKANKVTATVNGAAAVVAYVDDTHVKVTVPAGTPATAAASIKLFHDGVEGTPDATNAKYAAVITKLSKVSGPVTGTGSINITGKGLTTATGFTFGGVAATGCTAVVKKEDTDWTCTGIPAVAANSVTVKATFPASTISYGVLPTAAYTFSDVL